MSRAVFGLVLLLFLPALVSAQDVEQRSREIYLFGAPGVFLSDGWATLEFGGGAEWFVHKGFALGLDASILTYPECFQCGGYVIGSINGSYHLFRSSPRKVKPFVTAGFGGAASGDGSVGLVNFGGGLNYWFRDRLGLRVEVRDQVDTDFDVHQVSLRVGITF
jgi:hypothetical protein